jgi:hypothetical protein
MGVEKGSDDSLRPEQKEILDGLVRRFFVDGERCLLVEAPTGVGKTRIALEFVREFWRRKGRYEGISGEQLAFIKRLCYVVPNPPIDLVAVGNPTLLIEVKTTASDSDEITVDVYG